MTTHDNDNIATDILRGADAIAAFMGLPRRAIYHAAAKGTLPVFRLGETILARKSTLLAWIADQELAARTQRAA
ncbi:helix-turn-helix transcriptional regulator [Bosea sp. 2YAB26]|uniref:helix-turn-helix transcriptional regulator n=1 Tax=Bosea sp. 2YAB26 TaxID=3237478 RepID=UPI003F934740